MWCVVGVVVWWMVIGFDVMGGGGKVASVRVG